MKKEGWECPGCGNQMWKSDAFYFASHEPNCDWASMIPMSGRSGIRPPHRNSLSHYNTPSLIFMVAVNILFYFLASFFLTAYYTW